MGKKSKRSALTLLEVMVVILLIALIGGVVGVNLKGSLDEGRYFKTKEAKSQLKDIIEYRLAMGGTLAELNAGALDFVTKSGIAKDPAALLTDGWGEPLKIIAKSADDIQVESISPMFKKIDEKKQKK